MKKPLTISGDLYRQAKAFAASRGQTFGNLIEQSLRKVLLDLPLSRDSSVYWVQDQHFDSVKGIQRIGYW